MALLDLVVPVMLFSAASLSSPGPNNVMVTASGVNFGFRRTIPHMLGIAIGFAVMNLAVGLGLGRVFETYPQIHLVLKYVSRSEERRLGKECRYGWWRDVHKWNEQSVAVRGRGGLT